MANTFTNAGFGGTTNAMGASMARFFGGNAQPLSDLYNQAFSPITSVQGGTSPFAPITAGSGSAGPGTGSSFAPTGFSGGGSYSRFQPSLSQSGQQYLNQAMSMGETPATTTGTSATGGSGTAATSKYANLDAHNAEINSVAASEGVPANLLKSMINNESSGDWAGQGSHVVDPDGNGELVGFVGVRRAAAASVGIDFDQMVGNKVLQITAMARILKRDYAAYGSWEKAASNYFTGDPNAYTTGGTDSAGKPASTYVANMLALWHELDGSSGISQDPASPGYGTQSTTGAVVGQMATIYGSTPAHVSFEFGAEGGPDLYGYGTSYGLNGTQHTGVDIGMAVGSNLYAPMAGTVTCSGTNNGTGATGVNPQGTGCSAYNDWEGQGNGRIEIELDNGTVIILGHTSTSSVHPGQHVTAGELLGTSGGMNGPHVHVEVRVPDKSTASGYRIVDPSTVLGGGPAGPTNTSGGAGYGYGTAANGTSKLFIPRLVPQL